MAGVAVIIPYFQREPGLLVAAIRSALTQSYAGPVTILVCDDASPTPANADLELLTVAERASVLLLKQHNQGAGAARNAALDAVPPDTEWIAFLDSDDCWYPEHLSRSVAALRQGFDLCFADARREHEVLTHFQAAMFEPHRHEPLGCPAGMYRFTGDFLTQNIRLSPVSISTVVMRRSTAGQLRFLPIAVEDLMFWFEVARHGPRVVFDGTLQVLYGRGNITVTESWHSPSALRMALKYQCVFMRVSRYFRLTDEQRGILDRRMADNRSTFSRVILAHLRRWSWPDWRVVGDFLRTDPRIAFSLLSTATIEGLRLLPLGLFAHRDGR